MIRFLCRALGIEALMRRLDRRPSPTAHLPPVWAPGRRLAPKVHFSARDSRP